MLRFSEQGRHHRIQSARYVDAKWGLFFDPETATLSAFIDGEWVLTRKLVSTSVGIFDPYITTKAACK